MSEISDWMLNEIGMTREEYAKDLASRTAEIGDELRPGLWRVCGTGEAIRVHEDGTVDRGVGSIPEKPMSGQLLFIGT